MLKSFFKYLNIYKEILIMAFKKIKEYKIDFWSMFLFDFIVIMVYYFYFIVYKSIIGNIINFNNLDFLVYMLLTLVMWKIAWINNLRNLSRILLNGKINVYLTKPVNTYLLTSTEFVPASNFISLIYIFVIIFIIGQYNNYINYFIALLMAIFGGIYFILFYNNLVSIAFFMKNNNLIIDNVMKMNSITRNFTPVMFDEFSFSAIFYLLPVSISSFFVVQCLKGDFSLYLHYLPYIIISFISLFILLIIQWHFGLKKYEAFG